MTVPSQPSVHSCLDTFSKDSVNSFSVEYNKDDYFAFFKRLGVVYYPHLGDICHFVAVLRKHPRTKQNVWFIADYRTKKSLRGYRINTYFFTFLLPMMAIKSYRFYGIVMYPSGSNISYLKQWNNALQHLDISIYLVNYSDLSQVPEPYKTLKGIDINDCKRLINRRKNTIFPIIHLLPINYQVKSLNIINLSSGSNNVKDNDHKYRKCQYMFWLPSKSPCNFPVWSKAYIVFANLNKNEDFAWLSTADM